MRIFEGAYTQSPGMKFLPVSRLYEVEKGKNSVMVTGLHLRGPADAKIGGVAIRVEITSPLENVIRIRASHHGRTDGAKPGFLKGSAAAALAVTDNSESLRASSGSLSVEIGKKDWGIKYSWKSSVITESGTGGLGAVERIDGAHFMTEKLTLKPGECVYGLGERFSPFVRNGQSVAMWNSDPSSSSDLAYKNVPFYLTSAGYGVFVNTAARAEFEVATEDNSAVRITVPGHEMDYLIIGGDSPKEVLTRYTALTGRPPMIPKWSLGLWLTTSFTTTYDEKTIMEHVDGMKKRDIPLTVFHFDCYWMRERHWCDFRWDTAAFPDPVGMLKRLKSMGLSICVWINPYISELSSLYKEAAESGYLLKRPTGEVYRLDWWQPGNSFIDFTNPDARAWYCKQLEPLIDMGVDSFKTDFGESAPADAVSFDGSDGAEMHNRYTLEYNRAVFELLQKRKGNGNALVFARSATAGSQAYPIHWGGDSYSTYNSMAGELRGGLSFSLSGAAFWAHDIGGFYGTATPDLYKRWVAFGLLSSHSRLHGDSSYRVPWTFDDESVDVLRHFTKLRHSLLPYLYGCCRDAHETGLPVMRAMMLEFPNDPTCRHLDRQYMLGSSLLVAPVMSPDGSVEYYLPEGEWTDFQTGARVHGGRWQNGSMDYFSIPLYVKENSIIPVGPVENAPNRSSFDSLTLRIYGFSAKSSFALCDDTRTVEVSVEPSAAGCGVTLSEQVKDLRVSFMNTSGIKAVKGEAVSAESEKTSTTVNVKGTRFSISI
jgi:alpha-D-xyloside xylohydrolase